MEYTIPGELYYLLLKDMDLLFFPGGWIMIHA